MASSDEVIEYALRDGGLPARPSRWASPASRTCARDGCDAVLSRYNDATTCWLHGPGAEPARRALAEREAT